MSCYRSLSGPLNICSWGLGRLLTLHRQTPINGEIGGDACCSLTTRWIWPQRRIQRPSLTTPSHGMPEVLRPRHRSLRRPSIILPIRQSLRRWIPFSSKLMVLTSSSSIPGNSSVITCRGFSEAWISLLLDLQQGWQCLTLRYTPELINPQVVEHRLRPERAFLSASIIFQIQI